MINDLVGSSDSILVDLQLKHTYLRVLHPLLTNTQLRQYPHKRPQLRRVLGALISFSQYRDVDPTTRRLVERNLKGSWCDGIIEGAIGEGERRTRSDGDRVGGGWSSGMGRRTNTVGTGESIAYDDGGPLERSSSSSSYSPSLIKMENKFNLLGISESGNDSSISVNEIAHTQNIGTGKKKKHHSLNILTAADYIQSPFSPLVPTPSAQDQDISVLISPPSDPAAIPAPTRRRRPPPPPSPSSTSANSSRASTPLLSNSFVDIGGTSLPTLPPPSPNTARRAAPLPPALRNTYSI